MHIFLLDDECIAFSEKYVGVPYARKSILKTGPTRPEPRPDFYERKRRKSQLTHKPCRQTYFDRVGYVERRTAPHLTDWLVSNCIGFWQTDVGYFTFSCQCCGADGVVVRIHDDHDAVMFRLFWSEFEIHDWLKYEFLSDNVLRDYPRYL